MPGRWNGAGWDRPRRSAQRGMALLAAIIFITIVAMMAAAITYMHQSASQGAGEAIGGAQSFLLSESASEMARRALIGADCIPSAIEGATVSGNTTTVTRNLAGMGEATFVYVDEGNNTYRLTTSGTPSARGASQQRGASFDFICIPGGAGGGNGSGDVVEQWTGEPSESYVFNNTAAVVPGLRPALFPAYASGANVTASGVVNATAGPFGVVSTAQNANVTLDASGGDFQAKDLTIGQNGVITLTPGNYVFSGNVTLGSNARIVIHPPGSVTLSLQGSFRANQNSRVNSDAAAPLTVQLYGPQSTFALDQNAVFKGVALAPGAQTTVSLKQNANVEAAILTGGDVTLEQNVRFNGTLLSEQSVTVDQNANITGAVAANGNITLRQNVKLTGGVDAGGTLSAGANANITLRNPTPKPAWFANWSGSGGGGGGNATLSPVDGTWKESSH
ncbi:MAG: hypothetical protein HQL51_03540 [Magnetococcales bacterium]|nr:hypothetical protein [Magnetococcales bacterium]